MITEEGKLTPDDVLIMPMDITDLSKHKSAFDKVIQQFGQVSWFSHDYNFLCVIYTYIRLIVYRCFFTLVIILCKYRKID